MSSTVAIVEGVIATILIVTGSAMAIVAGVITTILSFTGSAMAIVAGVIATIISPGSRAGLFMSEPPYVSMVVSYVEFTQEFRYVSLTHV